MDGREELPLHGELQSLIQFWPSGQRSSSAVLWSSCLVNVIRYARPGIVSGRVKRGGGQVFFVTCSSWPLHGHWLAVIFLVMSFFLVMCNLPENCRGGVTAKHADVLVTLLGPFKARVYFLNKKSPSLYSVIFCDALSLFIWFC
jgi:hypothetical protein